MKLNKFQNEKAITLVALVVTIIVLIILAGISINLILGENGIIRKAKEAKEKHEAAVQEEKEQLDIAYDQIESLNPNSLAANVKVGDYVNYIPKAGETTTIYQGSYDGYVEYDDEGYMNWSTINENGETTASGELGSGLTDEESQTFTVPTDTSDIKWRVLSIENGVVNLISEKEIGRTGLWTGDWDDTLELEDITGYAYSEEVINKVCSIYGTGDGASGARSITVEDVNKLTGYDVTKDRGYNEDYGNIVKLDNYSHSWKWTYYYYNYNETGMNLKTENKESIEYKLLFDSDLRDKVSTSSTKNNYTYYWLASRCVELYSNYASFCVRCVSCVTVDVSDLFYCYSDGDTDYKYNCYPVRPIVSLKSTVQAGTSTTDESGITTWNIVVE